MGSAVWITDYDDDEPPLGMQGPTPPGRGKVPSRYEWRPGAMAGTPPGQHWHGEPEWFLSGLPADKLAQPPYTDWCGRPLMTEDGQAEPGGEDDIVGEQVVAVVFQADPSGTDDIEQGPTVATNFILDKVTPASLGSNQNNYLLNTGACFRLNATVPVDITGLAGGIADRVVFLENIGANLVRILHQDAGSLGVNRVITLDGLAARVWPAEGVWLQYDATTLRWREMQGQPFLAQRGDLLTIGTTPQVLQSSGRVGQVLTQQPSELTGLRWGDREGGTGGPGDFSYWRQVVPPSFGPYANRTYGSSAIISTTYGPLIPTVDSIYAAPFWSPRGGHIDRLRLNVTVGGAAGNNVVMGIYDSVGIGQLWPHNLLVATGVLDTSGVSTVEGVIDLDLDPNVLYWLACVVQTAGISTSTYLGYDVSPPWLPILGRDDFLRPDPNPPLLQDSFTWTGALPDPFPATSSLLLFTTIPVVGVRYDA
jgi:hypothetical protein